MSARLLAAICGPSEKGCIVGRALGSSMSGTFTFFECRNLKEWISQAKSELGNAVLFAHGATFVQFKKTI